jgi:predicted nucleic acid-binding protein
VKLYVEEAHSKAVRKWVEEAEIVATCRVAYPETVSAMTRRSKAGDLSKKEYDFLVTGFSREWNHFAAIDFDEFEAGRLVRKYGLRGLDAIHLSSAKLLNVNQNNISLSFSSFDDKLNNAATAEGLVVLMPDS